MLKVIDQEHGALCVYEEYRVVRIFSMTCCLQVCFPGRFIVWLCEVGVFVALCHVVLVGGCLGY